ncbi:basic phospholipase A2 PA-13-like [Montipora capricornis]|uniref:basic phospholipase A2 PA-13-like n=1 Tax=Montipora capricornis TaxID=246305 RepID=UPI0035F207F7
MFAWCVFMVVLSGYVCAFVNSIENYKENKYSSSGGSTWEEINSPSNKRGVFMEFRKMIKCATGRSAFDFLGYGCWCGLGGEGFPVDNLDRCCQVHDKCYEKLGSVCPIHKLSRYTIPYSTRSCTSCEPASYYWFWGNCRHGLCLCDAVAAKCFAKQPFNENFRNYPTSKCH